MLAPCTLGLQQRAVSICTPETSIPCRRRTHAQVLSVQPSFGRWRCGPAVSSALTASLRLWLVTAVSVVHGPFCFNVLQYIKFFKPLLTNKAFSDSLSSNFVNYKMSKLYAKITFLLRKRTPETKNGFTRPTLFLKDNSIPPANRDLSCVFSINEMRWTVKNSTKAGSAPAIQEDLLYPSYIPDDIKLYLYNVYCRSQKLCRWLPLSLHSTANHICLLPDRRPWLTVVWS